MALEPNQDWYDALVRHQVGILRATGTIRNNSLEAMEKSEQQLLGAIMQDPRKVNLSTIRGYRNAGWATVLEQQLEDNEELAANELLFLALLLRRILPVEYEPDVSDNLSFVRTNKPQGLTIKQWIAKLKIDDITRLRSRINIGKAQGQSAGEIAANVKQMFKRTSNNIASISRTVGVGTSLAARAEFIKDNPGFQDELYVAILDSRTTEICMSLDNNIYPIGIGPMPPVHFNCRSTRIPLLGVNFANKGKTKRNVENELVEQYSRANGLGNISRREDLPYGQKSKFDEFAEQQIKKSFTVLPKRESYSQWLTRQSTTTQNEILGKRRAQLFRSNKIELSSFVDNTGNVIPLSKLKTQ